MVRSSKEPRLPLHPMWQFYGPAGHFCNAGKCLFHIHTHVYRRDQCYCVSTVGEYYPFGFADRDPMKVGIDRLYETMVFEHDADQERNNYSELLMWGANDRETAERNHILACWLYTVTDSTAQMLCRAAREDPSAIWCLCDRLKELDLIPM